jgi:membrane protease YdiL (CAAX protease family)
MSELNEPPEQEIAIPVAEPEPAPAPPSLLRRIFIGPDGLRSGWSLLLFALPFLALFGIAQLAKHYMPMPPPAKKVGVTETPALVMIIGEVVQFGIFVLVAFLVSLIEKRSFAWYGLGGRGKMGRRKDLGMGLLWGLVMLSLLVGALRLGHFIAFDGVAQHGWHIPLFGLALGIAFFFVGLSEEFGFRGFVQFTGARGISGMFHKVWPRSRYAHAVGFWGAALLFSVGLFALAHTGNGGETPLGLAAVSAAGITLVFALWRTGNLWWSIGFHTTWDWAQSWLFGVADSGQMMQGHLLKTHPLGNTLFSGGTTGPEGSVLVFPTLLVACLVIHFTLPKRTYPVTPSQQPLE